MILFGLLIISLHVNVVENAPRRSDVLDCTGRDSDGLYGRGCSSKFLRCYNGKRYIYTCPKNLKFNVETAKCEQRQQVIACLNNMNNDKTIVKADNPFDCSKLKDGVYGSGKCSITYYHCSGGHSSEMLCPAGLYYNDKLKGCDKVDSIDECNLLTVLREFNEHRESYLGERGKYIEQNLMANRDRSIFDINERYGGGTHRLLLDKSKIKSYDSNDKKRPTRQILYQANSWKPRSEMNCTGMKDGDYSMIKRKCSKYFWRCSAGEITRRICRDELFFNTITGKCDTANNIANCVDKKSLIVARNAISCPEGQVYDVKEKQCHVADSIQEYVTAKNSSSSIIGNSTQIARIVSAPELNNFCEKNGDGLFSAGCENYFYFCASGFGYHVNCPEGLFFDSKTKNCNYKEHVLFCNLTPKNSKISANDYTTTPGSMDQNKGYENRETKNYNIQGEKVIHNHANHVQEAGLSALVDASISKIKSLPLLPENFDCRQKADGFYSIGCKTEFVACFNHRMFFFECPHNLIFNEEKQSCDYKGNIKNCSKSLSKMTDIDEKESFSIINSEMESEISSEEKIEQIDDTVISEQDFCKKLRDGIYFNSCGNQYTVCSGEIAFIYNCPEGQIMDSASKTCNEPENILECMNKNDRI